MDFFPVAFPTAFRFATLAVAIVRSPGWAGSDYSFGREHHLPMAHMHRKSLLAW